MNYVRELVGPTVEPTTLAEARLWCRVDDDDETQDAMLLLLIAAAREKAEEITGRGFASRRLEYRMDAFPTDGSAIELPFPPLRSVEYITYATSNGDVTLSGSPQAFDVDTGSTPGRIAPLNGGGWPSASDQIASVRIGYTCGYAKVTAMPKALRIYMQARVATIYEHREQLVMNNIVEIPRDFCEGMLDGLRVKTGFV